MYNEEGETIWERSLDMNGKVQEGSHRGCPFMYQGQYYDEEIELAYNRFRYYSSEDGRYISKDPIGVNSGEYNFYNYVDDSNTWIDPFGLDLHRPYIRKSTRVGAENNARVRNGRFVDPNTGKPISGGKMRKYSRAEGKYHMGHKYGHEHRTLLKEAEAKGMTQKEFNDFVNDPDKFQIEDPHENMSHKHEKKKSKIKKGSH